MIRGSKMSAEACAKISASLKGNQYRKGKPHPPHDRAKISAAVKEAYASGRRKPSLAPENLAEHNAAIQSGEKQHQRKNPQRDFQIVERYRVLDNLEAVGLEFGITGAAAGYAVRRIIKPPRGTWSKKCMQ